MKKEVITSKIKRYLEQQDGVSFALIFGSFIKNETFRDIDVAIYTDIEFDLMVFGTIQSGLTENTRQDIDLTSLNSLPRKNPALAYEIVTEGQLLFYSNKEKFTAFKRKALLHYFDTRKLREEVKQAFVNRLESDKFGQRNYV